MLFAEKYNITKTISNNKQGISIHKCYIKPLLSYPVATHQFAKLTVGYPMLSHPCVLRPNSRSREYVVKIIEKK